MRVSGSFGVFQLARTSNLRTSKQYEEGMEQNLNEVKKMMGMQADQGDKENRL